MKAPLTAAEAWCWVAHMMGVEAMSHQYAWPPSQEHVEAANELSAAEDAAYDRACSLDHSDDLWRRALAKWESP